MSRSISRRRTLAILALVPFLGSAPATLAANGAPTTTIQRFYDALLAAMRAGRNLSFAQRFQQLAPAVEAALDLAAILEASIGPNWATMSADQHAALLAAFRQYTISTYASNFDSYAGQRFIVTPATRPLANGTQVVSTQIVSASGETHRLDYVMRQSGGTWKIVDVLEEGSISQVAVQRSDFRRLLMSGGGSALIASLQRKSRDLQAG